MSTADDQIASLLAAAGAADVLDKHVASHRDRARAVLRRQAERIARLEHLLGLLRQGPLPAAGALPAPAPAPSPAPEITQLLRELMQRQEAAEQRQLQRQEQLLAALQTQSAGKLPTASELAAPLSQLLEEFRREQRAYTEQSEQRWQKWLEDHTQQLQAHASGSSELSKQHLQLLGELQQSVAAQPAMPALAEEIRAQLEPQLAAVAQRIETSEKQREQHEAQLRKALEELRDRAPTADPSSSEITAALRELVAQHQETSAAQQRDTAHQTALLTDLAQQVAATHAEPADTSTRDAVERLAAQLAAQAKQQVASVATHDASLQQILAELQQQNQRLATLPATDDVHALFESLLQTQHRAEQQQALHDEQQRAELAALRKQLTPPDAAAERHDRVLEQIVAQLEQQRDLLASPPVDRELHKRLEGIAASQQRATEQQTLQQQEQRAALQAIAARLEPSADHPLQHGLAQLLERVEEHHQQQLEHGKKLAAALAKLHSREALATQKDQLEIAQALSELAERQQQSDAARQSAFEQQAVLLRQLDERLTADTGDQARAEQVAEQVAEQSRLLASIAAQLETQAEERRTGDAQLADIASALEQLATVVHAPRPETEAALRQWGERYESLQQELRAAAASQTEVLQQLQHQVQTSSAQREDTAHTTQLLERWERFEKSRTQLDKQLREALADLQVRTDAAALTATAEDVAPLFQELLARQAETARQLQEQREQQQQLVAELRTQATQRADTTGDLAERWTAHCEATQRTLEDLARQLQVADTQHAARDAEQKALWTELQASLAAPAATSDDAQAELLNKMFDQLQAAREHQQQYDEQLAEILTHLEQLQTKPSSAAAAATDNASSELLQQVLEAQQAAAARSAEQQAEYRATVASLNEQLAALRAAAPQTELVEKICAQLAAQEQQRQAHDDEWHQRLAALYAEQQRDAACQPGLEDETNASVHAALEQLAAVQQQHAAAHAAELAELRSLITGLREHAPSDAHVEPLGDIVAQLDELRATLASAVAPATGADGAAALLQSLVEQHQAAEQQRQADQQMLTETLARLADGPAAPTSAAAEDASAVSQLLEQFAEQQMAAEERQAEAQRQLTRTLAALQTQVEDLAEQMRASAAGAPLAFPRPEPRTPRTAPKETTLSPSLGWEEAKQRLLAQLESESDDDQAPLDYHDTEAQPTEDETAATAAFLENSARADEEIAALRRQIEEYRQAAASTSVVDKDELVQQERERLRVLQEEWQEKLRKAEIDISIERAKLARERTRLEEQLQTIQQERGDGAAEDPSGKAGKNRWLARLGLLEEQK